jgi:hypothetical protein
MACNSVALSHQDVLVGAVPPGEHISKKEEWKQETVTYYQDRSAMLSGHAVIIDGEFSDFCWVLVLYLRKHCVYVLGRC